MNFLVYVHRIVSDMSVQFKSVVPTFDLSECCLSRMNTIIKMMAVPVLRDTKNMNIYCIIKYACVRLLRDEKQNLKYINNGIRSKVPNMKIQLNRKIKCRQTIIHTRKRVSEFYHFLHYYSKFH